MDTSDTLTFFLSGGGGREREEASEQVASIGNGKGGMCTCCLIRGGRWGAQICQERVCWEGCGAKLESCQPHFVRPSMHLVSRFPHRWMAKALATSNPIRHRFAIAAVRIHAAIPAAMFFYPTFIKEI